jgi:hypothetical protein
LVIQRIRRRRRARAARVSGVSVLVSVGASGRGVKASPIRRIASLGRRDLPFTYRRGRLVCGCRRVFMIVSMSTPGSFGSCRRWGGSRRADGGRRSAPFGRGFVRCLPAAWSGGQGGQGGQEGQDEHGGRDVPVPGGQCRKHDLRAPAKGPGVLPVGRGHRMTRRLRLIPGSCGGHQ